MNGKKYIFGSCTETETDLNASSPLTPCSLCPGEWRNVETWAFLSALPPTGRISRQGLELANLSRTAASSAGSQIPHLRAAALSCMPCLSLHCVAELAYTLSTSCGEWTSGPHGPAAGPLFAKQMFWFFPRPMRASQWFGKLRVIETIPMYLGLEDSGDITKASADTTLNSGFSPLIQIAVILCLLHARQCAAYYR